MNFTGSKDTTTISYNGPGLVRAVGVVVPDVIAGRFPVIDTLKSAEENSGFVVAIGWLALQVKSCREAEDAVNRIFVVVILLWEAPGLEELDSRVDDGP